MQEIWKDIYFTDKGIVYDYRGLYQVSNWGRVKSLRYNKEKNIKPFFDKDGYLNLTLHQNKKEKKFKVHRLVASHFIPNPENKPQVNHINGKKDCNIYTNLEWCTDSENKQHALKEGLKPTKRISQYDLQGNLIREWGSITDASRKMKISSGNICCCCQKKLNQAGGYVWRYL